MALYAIGDLHLSLSADKPMDVFGGAWKGYMEKLREGLSCIGPEDTTVLLGELSWALGMDAAKEDFAFINEKMKQEVEPGDFIIRVGDQELRITLEV